jgi:methionyl-tRNA synthetase
LRFYLSSNLPETGDVVFSWRDFQSRVNSDLIGNLGNYINRVLSFAEKYFDGEIPRPEELPDDALAVLEDFKALEARYEERMLAPRPREALGELLAMGRRANRFFDASAPWKTRKEDPEQTRLTLYVCSVLLGSIAYHAAPYVPEAIDRLGGFFEGPIARVSDLDVLPQGYHVTGAKPLFRRIEDDEVAAAEGQLSRAVSGEAV